MVKKEETDAAKAALKKEAMLKALKLCLGVVTEAAEQANINPRTHYRWLDADPEYKEAVHEITETALDFAEGQLFKVMKGYKMPETKVFCTKEGDIVTHNMEKHIGPDTTAIIFFLKTKGKHRGYIEPQRIQLTNGEGDNEKELTIRIVRPDGDK